MRAIDPILLLASIAMLQPGCGQARTPDAPEPNRRALPPPATVDVSARTASLAAASIQVGTRPGTANRSAETEADLVPVTVPTVDVDIAPYPNRANEPARTGVTRAEAEQLCAAADRRLCHELEWERACRAGGSALGTMGTNLREWTAGPATRFADATAAIVRGSSASERDPDRCGVRRSAPSTSGSADIGFRCCGGDAPELAYPVEASRAVLEDRSITTDEARAALAGVPELASYAAAFAPFSAADVAQVFVRGGVAENALGARRIVRGALRFAPRPFDEALILTGRSGQTSLIAVLYPTGNGYVHGASMVLENDPVSVLITYMPGSTTIGWTSCFDCSGEGGTIELRPDGRIVIVQR